MVRILLLAGRYGAFEFFPSLEFIMERLGLGLIFSILLLSLIGCGGGGGSNTPSGGQPTDNPSPTGPSGPTGGNPTDSTPGGPTGGNATDSTPGGPTGGNPTPSIVLSWQTPISPTDGMPFADVAGYNIYYGKSPRNYSTYIDVGNLKNYTVSTLPQGTYYFAVTAYDSFGTETDFSNEVKQSVP